RSPPAGSPARWPRSRDEAAMLTKRLLVETDGIRVEDVVCGGGDPHWSGPERVGGYSIVFVRRGCFRRRVQGLDDVVDAAVAYFERPGDEQEVAHPVAGGDACTTVAFPAALV